jgi:hypothetical protein
MGQGSDVNQVTWDVVLRKRVGGTAAAMTNSSNSTSASPLSNSGTFSFNNTSNSSGLHASSTAHGATPPHAHYQTRSQLQRPRDHRHRRPVVPTAVAAASATTSTAATSAAASSILTQVRNCYSMCYSTCFVSAVQRYVPRVMLVAVEQYIDNSMISV